MKLLGIEFKKFSQWNPFPLIREIGERVFDDSPVDRKYVEDIVNTVEASPLTYKFTGQFNAIMSIMLWRASCNGFNDLVERISSSYKDKIDSDMAGQSFWCAALEGNIEGMEILHRHFGYRIADKDFSEALARAAYHEDSPVIDYLFETHPGKLGADAVNSALDSAATFASTNNIKKLFALRGHQITKEGIDNALERIETQRSFCTDLDYEPAAVFLKSKQQEFPKWASAPQPS